MCLTPQRLPLENKRSHSVLLYLRLSGIFPWALKGLRVWFIGRIFYDFLLVQSVTVLLLTGHTHRTQVWVSCISPESYSLHICLLWQLLVVLKRVIMVCCVKRCHFCLPFSLCSWFSKRGYNQTWKKKNRTLTHDPQKAVLARCKFYSPVCMLADNWRKWRWSEKDCILDSVSEVFYHNSYPKTITNLIWLWRSSLL